MKRIFITGIAGFLGTHLSRALSERGDFVVGLTRDWVGTGPEIIGRAHAIVDGSFEQVERAIAEYEIDTVIHLAAQTQVSTAVADPIGSLETNVRGTWTVLEACRRQKVDRIIIASSDKAYGDSPAPYTEDTSLRPHGIYATSKAAADMIAQAYAQEYRLSIAITRCGNLYGSGHLNFSTLIPGTIRSLLQGERPKLRSDGGPKRDFLYVEDAVDGYLKLIDAAESFDSDSVVTHGLFNLGTGVGSSVTDVVKTITRLMKSDIAPLVERNSRSLEIQEQILCCGKARNVLDWEPKHTLKQGLEKTIAWYKEHLK